MELSSFVPKMKMVLHSVSGSTRAMDFMTVDPWRGPPLMKRCAMLYLLAQTRPLWRYWTTFLGEIRLGHPHWETWCTPLTVVVLRLLLLARPLCRVRIL